MASSFDRWEKDPFFSAAEEVQESADRMESIYRQWIHQGSMPSGDLRRDLHTALGTAKWQLEELVRAVTSNDDRWSAGETTRSRHGQFAAAITDRISMVEGTLMESNLKEGVNSLSWVRLDQGERDELALFLSCSPPPIGEKLEPEAAAAFAEDMNSEASVDCSKNFGQSKESNSHRNTVSATDTSDMVVLKISESNEQTCRRPLDDQPDLPPPRILGFSGRWYRNGFRNWKGGCQHDIAESMLLLNHQLSQGIDACYERSKSCLNSCGEEPYDKQIDGWAGAFHRQLQRSQYHIQYGRPVQMVVWTLITILLIVLFVLRAS